MHTQLSCALSLIQNLYLKNRNFCSSDYDSCLSYINEIIPLTIHTYTDNLNHWQIPPKWDLQYAYIKNLKDELIYEVDHPLKIIGLSTSLDKIVSKEELLTHLHFDHRFPAAIPYHFRQFYRPWERTWGFCVTEKLYKSLQEPFYKIEIATSESKGNLKVADITIKGEHPFSFVFVAHLDHPGMANDDLAGVAVGVELFRRLSSLKTKFSYKLLLVPEIIGSEFYLGHASQESSYILEGCFLEMLGSNTPLALQHSLKKESQIEKILLTLLSQSKKKFNQGPFKSIICNDEYIWEAHQIPMCSLSRFPYPEYHTHFDNLSIINENALEEAVQLLYQVIVNLEELTLIEKKFSGTPCLSHPDYNLYIDPGQRAFGNHADKETLQQRLLMDLIPCQKQLFFIESLIEEAHLSKASIFSYLKKWEQKNLLKIF